MGRDYDNRDTADAKDDRDDNVVALTTPVWYLLSLISLLPVRPSCQFRA